MTRLVVTALSAVTIVSLGIVSLHYRQQELADAGLTGNNAEAFNMTREVSTGVMTIAGNAMPRLLMIVIIVMVIVMLLIIRG